MTENAGQKTNCESCGEEFSCGAKTIDCWCFEINTNPEFTAELNRNFNDCLCRSCLSQQIVRRKIKVSGAELTIAENKK